MAQNATTINGHEITKTECLAFALNDSVLIRPFDDDKDYAIELEIVISEENKEKMRTQIIADDRPYPLLRVTRALALGAKSSPSKKLLIAADQDFNYFIFFVIEIGGNEHRHFVNLIYTITQSPK